MGNQSDAQIGADTNNTRDQAGKTCARRKGPLCDISQAIGGRPTESNAQMRLVAVHVQMARP